MFPIQTERGAKPHPLKIPWSVAEKAYSVYAVLHGSQSLQRLAERGGFGPSEMDTLHPTWREEASEIAQQAEQIAALQARIVAIKDAHAFDKQINRAGNEAVKAKLEAQNRALREAAQAWIEVTKPVREEWLTDTAYEAHCAAYNRLRAALATPGIAPATNTEQPSTDAPSRQP
jgi:hypothetical protein